MIFVNSENSQPKKIINIPNKIKKQEETLKEEYQKINSIEDEYTTRRLLLAAEHEARHPICKHCGKKTKPVFQYRRKDGGPDMRYHENPVICNQCYRPYSGARPWNLAEDMSKEEMK